MILSIPYPSPEYREALRGLLGESCILCYAYPEYSAGVAYGACAERIADRTSTPERLESGINWMEEPILWYSIDLQWLQLSGDELVRACSSAVCICPIDQRAVSEFERD